MNFVDYCLDELRSEKLFENSAHYTRFKELMECFSDKHFFNKGICKCMYLSSWDDEHFMVILQMLNMMSVSQKLDLSDMEANGEDYAEHTDPDQALLYNLSVAFISGQPYVPENLDRVSEETRRVYNQTMKAAGIIERIFK